MTIRLMRLPGLALRLQTHSTTFPGSLTSDAIDQDFLNPLSGPTRKQNKGDRTCQKEELRHILLGSPGAIQQAIHQLHVLNYAETVLWSPTTAVDDRIIITPEQGEAMSLLRRSV